jgi:orotidine-5'-phosphate decarboxylase
VERYPDEAATRRTIVGMPSGHDIPARERLIVPLDVATHDEALALVERLGDSVAFYKVGFQLLLGGDHRELLRALTGRGKKVFLDLKLFDIPTTVNRATRVLGALGVEYLTLHALGGVDMLRAGVDGLNEGAAGADLPSPTALAVTVLTSDGSAPAHIVPNRVRQAVEGGCGGLILAASDLQTARELAPRLKRVVPGIRLAGSDRHDQARSATPQEAVANGADLLVIGRTVTASPDPRAAAAAVAAAV